MMRVYERIGCYIADEGLKRKAVATKAGIPPATFYAIMSGKRKLYADELAAICTALSVSSSTFIN